MKIIDLLVKISQGERMPKKIKYEGYVWEYDKVAKDYYRNDIDEEYIYLFQDLFKKKTGFFINNEVEIIEEPKKIEKIKILIDEINMEYVANDKGEKLSYSESDLIFADRINKLIEKINKLNVDFKDTSLIQIMCGYETKTSASVLESNLTEVGLAPAVIHDKGSYCHGRSNLLFQYPNSKLIYLSHGLKELDSLLIESINSEYSNISVFDTNDLSDNIFWKEYYLILQMYFLSKKIAEDKNIDLTQPEYNPTLVKKLYKFKGEM